MAALSADADGDPLGFRLLISGEHGADAGSVHRHWLLGKDVLARGHGGFEKRRAESRRRGQDDVVHIVQRQHLLISVEADEATVFGHVHIARNLALFQHVEAGVEVVLEHVAHSDQLDARSGPQHIRGRSGAALAAADQSDADHVAACGVSPGNRAQARCDSSAQHRRRGPFE